MRKIIPYILILIVLTTLFSFGIKVDAQTPATTGCYNTKNNPPTIIGNPPWNEAKCNEEKAKPANAPFQITWIVVAGTSTTPTDACLSKGAVGSPAYNECKQALESLGQPLITPTNDNGTALERNLKSCSGILYGNFDGCLIKLSYYLFNGLPSFFLGLVTQLFNVLVALSLSSTIYSSPFISDIWGIVRDLSNIFFILILLYIGVKVILGLGGHDVKKMIVNVIIMALLINFSMFFTKIVVDASNILALIFYNKINVEVQIKKSASAQENKRGYLPITDPTKTGVIEKDISGGLAAAFNPGAMLSDEFFNKARNQTQVITSRLGFYSYLGGGALAGSAFPVVGTLAGAGIGGGAYIAKSIVAWAIPTKEIPTPLMLGIIIVNGLILCLAIYAFFTAAWAFLGRIIELWILMIFSPFAFMSFSIPLLGHIEYIGWDAWFKRLIQVSFMAPVFMFFMYFIFKVVNANIFNSLVDRANFKDQGTVEAILLIVIPALLICILLKKAADYAQKASGVLGQSLTKIAGVATGAIAGGGFGLAARGLQGTLGHLGKKVFESETLTDWEANGKGWRRTVGSGLRTIGGGDDGKGGFAGSSFDARKGIVGGGLKLASNITGINFGSQSKMLSTEAGGFVADEAKRDAKIKKRLEGLGVKEGEKEKQKLNEAEEGKHGLVLDNSERLHVLNEEIAGAETNRTNYKELAASQPNNKEAKARYDEYANKVIELKARKSEINGGGEIVDKKGNPTGEYATHNRNVSKEYVKDINAEKVKADSVLKGVEASRTGAEAARDSAIASQAAAEELAKIAKESREKLESEAGSGLSTDESLAESIKEAIETEKETAEKFAAASDNVASKLKDLDKLSSLEKKAKDIIEKAKRANEAEKKLQIGPDGEPMYGKSLDELDHLIPHLKHEIEKINHHRLEGFAKGIEQQTKWWNKAARKKTVSEMRRGIKGDKHSGGGHNDDHGSILDEALLAGVFAKAFDNNDQSHSTPAAGHGDDHGGDHGGGGGGHKAH